MSRSGNGHGHVPVKAGRETYEDLHAHGSRSDLGREDGTSDEPTDQHCRPGRPAVPLHSPGDGYVGEKWRDKGVKNSGIVRGAGGVAISFSSPLPEAHPCPAGQELEPSDFRTFGKVVPLVAPPASTLPRYSTEGVLSPSPPPHADPHVADHADRNCSCDRHLAPFVEAERPHRRSRRPTDLLGPNGPSPCHGSPTRRHAMLIIRIVRITRPEKNEPTEFENFLWALKVMLGALAFSAALLAVVRHFVF